GWYPMYTLPPGTEAGAWGDQAPYTSAKAMGPLVALLAAGARNPYWRWYADELGATLPDDYVGFLFAAASENLEAKKPDDLPASRAFTGVGVATLNTSLLDGARNTQVHFKSSPFGRQSHGYNANNAFLLYLQGKPVFIRSGRRDVHGSPHHVKWMWQTRSDNAILVNGTGQIVHEPNATGEIAYFETSDAMDVVVGEAGQSYDPAILKRWTRRIFFLKPAVVVIHDLLEAPEPSTFQWLLHARGQFEIADQAAVWSGDPGSVQVKFLTPAGLGLTQTDAFDPPPAEWTGWDLGEWHLTAETSEKQARQQFITLLQIDGAETAPDLAPENDGYRLQLTPPGSTPVTLHLGWEDFTVEGGAATTDPAP
ncbi:MAG: heparinase II/III family protein, partial [Candidatus Hydrogenedentes bacterium]|nr:heparinase II/III family protein [Candidatus Hydrogenedentota bacterium]